MQHITLKFTPQRLDYIAGLLVQRPYAEVEAIITDLRAQVAEQQRPAAEPVDIPMSEPIHPPAGDR